jgi:hypothetical protein
LSKNLFVFGCSYSSEFVNSGITDLYFYYKGYWPKTWTKHLSEKLDYNLVNFSKGANSNNQIFEDVCKYSNLFKKEDIVIIQWSYINRYRWVNFKLNKWKDYSVSNHDNDLDSLINDNIVLNRQHYLYKDEVLNWQKMIETLSKIVGFHLYIWDGSYDFLYQNPIKDRNDRKYICSELIPQGNAFIDMIFNQGGNRILEETEGKVNDIHLGEIGQRVQGDLFYQHIKKDLNL